MSNRFWLVGDASGLRLSHFIGDDRRMSFVTQSHIRIYKDSPESEFAKISYELLPDSRDDAKRGLYVLVRTESPNAFDPDERDPFEKKYELLRGIKSLTFSYYKWDQDKFKIQKNWDNERDEFKNIYPDVIEMKLNMEGEERVFFEGTFKFKPEFPFYGIPARI
ncbi:MAG: hypothetical protein HYX41_03180 [Bdellovibrio sp.]|nr:hypothetical protein [Bdellovibrio sp.]